MHRRFIFLQNKDVTPMHLYMNKPIQNSTLIFRYADTSIHWYWYKYKTTSSFSCLSNFSGSFSFRFNCFASFRLFPVHLHYRLLLFDLWCETCEKYIFSKRNIIKFCFDSIFRFGTVHCKKCLSIFPSPAGMSLTKLSLVGKNLIIPVQGEFGKWHPGWGREYW